ncbi:MAG: TatD family hydrolase [Candidatus Dormibacteraeota bacterium]|nr:TatD family hydrolase [Candidatus Dormibacteraeota bacterium]MBV9526343.1 TatD family hydrolase [Candidatus Dormibacteraeota bacterium]
MSSTALIDSHCHLVLLQERGLLQRALEGAQAAGVEAIISVGVNLEDSDRNREIAEQHSAVYFTVGWDPQQPRSPGAAELNALAELLRHPRAVAVGEVGLDLFFRPGYHETPVEVQRESFRLMLELARDQGKPVVVHDRDAHAEVLGSIAAVPGSRGVMHCFTGDAEHARRSVQAGFPVSFAGIVTFKNAETIRDAARAAGAGDYLVETDAPFLAPAPHRGTVNLPERVAVTAAAVAALRGEDDDAVRAATAATARAVFGIGGDAGGGV